MDNEPHLYGSITGEAVARVEIQAPDRNRGICLAVTAPDRRDRGRPSSWSAALDDLAVGSDGDDSRLFFVAVKHIFIFFVSLKLRAFFAKIFFNYYTLSYRDPALLIENKFIKSKYLEATANILIDIFLL